MELTQDPMAATPMRVSGATRSATALVATLCFACHGAATAPSDCTANAGSAALSRCLTPHQPMAYYAEQGNKYFDALDSTANRDNHPAYAVQVARWEWPPWLKLTGYGRDMIISTDRSLTGVSTSPIPIRDCRGFAVQPFGRCKVSFAYTGGGCPIYEEFTFNDQGETTFIEAWSDLPGLRPMDPSDPWAEGDNIHRLSTRIPGLGSANGLIDVDSAAMQKAADQDAEVADFVRRARDFWPTWTDELQSAGSDLYPRGCGWATDGGSP